MLGFGKFFWYDKKGLYLNIDRDILSASFTLI